jgi:hypothetical protein
MLVAAAFVTAVAAPPVSGQEPSPPKGDVKGKKPKSDTQKSDTKKPSQKNPGYDLK